MPAAFLGTLGTGLYLKKSVLPFITPKAKGEVHQGYRNRYDVIDHGHEKKPFVYFFQRSISTEIREFATIVLWKLVTNFSYRGHTILVYISFLDKWRHKIVTVFKNV